VIKIFFNNEFLILEVEFIGEIHFTDLFEYGEMIRQDKDLPRDLKILTDATHAIYKLSPEEIALMLYDLKKQIKPYHSVKTAVIQDKPFETAISMLVDVDLNIPDYMHKVFSTREAAMDWLLE
jgi:hypothetical protein